MITLMSRDTCRFAHIPEEFIVDMKEDQEYSNGRVYPYTRLHIVDSKQGHDYTIDVIESKRKIESLIEQNKQEGK